MAAQPTVYGPLGTLRTAQLSLAILLAETCETVHGTRACELLDSAIATNHDVPLWIVRRVLTSVALSDPPELLGFAERVLQRLGPTALDDLVRAQVGQRVPAVLDALLARASDEDRALTLRFVDSCSLLREASAAADRDRMRKALDVIESLAQDDPERSQFLELLDSPSSYEPGWAREEARDARIRLLARSGRVAEASGLLADAFHQAMSLSTAEGLVESEDLLRQIEEYGEHEIARDLRRRLQAVQVQAGAIAGRSSIGQTETSMMDLELLFVGGNETQEQYDDDVRKAINEKWPRVTVHFRHTGWSAHWGPLLENMRGLLSRCHAIVLMRFVRTELGRAVRKECGERGIPWVACTGRGFASMCASLEAAIQLVFRKLAKREGESGGG
jgi:hypothetical protein